MGGYCLAQEFIERHSGKIFAYLADKFLFLPLGLKNTTFKILQNDKNCAIGHYENGQRVKSGWYLYPETIAAGLWTTPLEYLKILEELIKGFDGKSDIIPKNIADEILTPIVSYEKNGHRYQYTPGIGMYSDDIYGHSGNNCGYKNLFVFSLREKKAFVIMSNDDNGKFLLDMLNWHNFSSPLGS